jgi:hypothetical protein
MPYAGAMNKLLKFLLWLVGVAVFLLATAHFTLRHTLNTPKFKAAATGFIERATGRPADYDRIDYTLFPFSLVIRNAALKEPGGTQDFAAMEEFSVYVDWRAREITSLTLARPVIRIVQHPDGTFNISDLLPAPTPKTGPDGPGTPGEPTERPTPAPEKEPSRPAEPPMVLRLVQIEQARFEFTVQDAGGGEETFTATDLDLTLRDVAPDLPVQLKGQATLGRTSSFAFELAGPPPADYADRPGAWPINAQARLDIRDFADLKAFLPPDTLPFQRLEAALDIQGALAETLVATFRLQTPDATDSHPVALDIEIKADLSLPPPVLRHLFAGEPLPKDWRVDPPPCTPPPGAMTLTDDPTTALLLRHLQATAQLRFPQIAYGQNQFTDGSATLHLRGGVATIPDARLAAYGGTLTARGNVQLLACPLSYRLDRLSAQNLELALALAANGLDDLANVSGRMNLEASLAGHAVAEPALRSLEADATIRIDDLQSVGSGGSLMDQIWLQLDHPLLLRWAPRIQPKVENARVAASTVTTSRYEEATATLALRNGTATLSDARLAMPDYRLHLAGTILPFDDQLDLAARLVASPAETQRLTDGKDRSAYLPYEDGGLMIPLAIRGPLQKPRVLPNLDALLQNALSGGAIAEELAPHLENLSDTDKKHVQEGLQLIQGLGTLLKK